jgi:4-nitrotryptophan synthase
MDSLAKDALLLSDPGIIPDPYPVYAALAKRRPVHWCEKLNAWAIMTYAECANALRDPRLKCERMEKVLSAKFPHRTLPPHSIYHKFTKNVMMYTDSPLHDSLRRSVQAGFTRQAHEEYSAVIGRVAEDLVASIPKGKLEIDAVEELTGKLPVKAAIHVFGAPEEDLPFIIPKVNIIMTYWSGPQDQPIALEQVLNELDDLHLYALELIQGNKGKVLPGTVIARLAESDAAKTECTFDQVIHQLVLMLIAMLAPTTPGSLSSGLLAFATSPDQIERFLSDSSSADNTANEVFRFNASNQFIWRLAGAAVEIGDVRIEEGDLLAPFLGSANRDPQVFDEPNRFDLTRRNSAQHLSFGTGLHSCLARQIASMEVAWFFVALFKAFPKLRLADKPMWNSNLEFRSLKSLPIRLQ